METRRWKVSTQVGARALVQSKGAFAYRVAEEEAQRREHILARRREGLGGREVGGELLVGAGGHGCRSGCEWLLCVEARECCG